MKHVSLTIVEHMALAVAVLTPIAACAHPTDQVTRSRRAPTAKAAGVSLANFVSRHDKKFLADDTDGDGRVSRSEFLAAVKAGPGDPARRFARIDANGDGMIDRSEIDAMLTRRFTHLDTTGDGVVDAAERTAAHNRKGRRAGDGAEA